MKLNYPTHRILAILAIFLVLPLLVTSQNSSECGVIETPESLNFLQENLELIKSYEKDFLTNDNQARAYYSIPIKAHVIRTSGGFGGLSTSQLNSAIAVMNAFYANANMYFYLCEGINYIDNSTYYDYVDSSEAAMTGTYNVNGLINIYFANSVTRASSGSAICGYAYYPGGPDVIVMDNSCALNGSTLAHEMGHFFSLRHTHGSSSIPDEYVDGTNCTTAGDYICDTPADPTLSYSNVTSSCVYIGSDTDPNGDFYVPDPTNVMSYSRKPCRTYFSPQQYARIYATYQTVRNNFDCPTFSVDFTADATQTCQNSLTVNFTDSSVGATSWEWDVDGDLVTDYTTPNPTHVYNTPGIYDVSLVVSNAQTSIIKSVDGFVSVGSNESLPLSRNFNALTDIEDSGWKIDSNSSFSWTLNAGTTTSTSTGPNGDNSTMGDGLYIYTEASGSGTGDVATYTSPCIEINSVDAVLSFYYHMYGDSMGELHVDIDSGSGFTNDVTPVISGQQQASTGEDYLQRQIDLSAYANQSIVIRFRAIRGNSYNSDIAIDDIDIVGTLSVNDYFADNTISVYPNPTNSMLNIKLSDTNNLPDSYSIYNMLGQLVEQRDIAQESDLSINVEAFSEGMYFVKLKKDSNSTTIPFIKN
ncbi:T9SS type A sorting domain-containing protein [Psychroserpens sp. XS_ASV72]|uniref:T9SS type A sorting domain-containing protein n=1 Tax=Psychroserpens sp. XS_ASV72 TaxID=3241293 RepID=UPI0035192FA0